MIFEQTKGYATLRGKVYGIDGKEPMATGSKTTLRIRVNTSKGNSVFVTVGGWDNSQLHTTLKAKGMDKSEEFLSPEVPTLLADYFADGDSVFIQGMVEVNTYKEGRLDINATKIFASTDEIDFDAEGFDELAEINIPAIVNGDYSDGKLPVIFATYKGATIEKELVVEEEPIKEFLKDVKAGDLLPTTIKVKNMAVYGDSEEVKPRKTLMGRSIGSKKTIVGTESSLVLVDIDVDKIELGKYKDIEDIDMPF